MTAPGERRPGPSDPLDPELPDEVLSLARSLRSLRAAEGMSLRAIMDAAARKRPYVLTSTSQVSAIFTPTRRLAHLESRERYEAVILALNSDPELFENERQEAAAAFVRWRNQTSESTPNTEGGSSNSVDLPSHRATSDTRASLRSVVSKLRSAVSSSRGRVLLAGALIVAILCLGAWLFVSTVNSFTSPSSIADPFFVEDFSGDRLDPAKWVQPSDVSHLYPRDRVLNMSAPLDRSEAIDTDLKPRNVGTFREVDFTLSIPEYQRPGPGGGTFEVTESNGRTQRFVFGPSQGARPLSAYPLTCARLRCSTYDDFSEPTTFPEASFFRADEHVPVKIVQNESTLTFLMRGVPVGDTPIVGPLTDFRFNMYSGAGEQWRITIDAIRVYR